MLELFAQETDGKKVDEYIDAFRNKYKETLAAVLSTDVLSDRKSAFLINSLTKRKVVADHVTKQYDIISFIGALCRSADAKVRKNAYSAIGNLKDKKFLPTIRERICKEDVYFTYATMVEAYYACGGQFEKLKSFIDRIDVEDPHYAEIERAYARGRRRKKENEFSGFPCGVSVLFTCPSAAVNELSDDIKREGRTCNRLRNGVLLSSDAANALYGKIRTYDEAMVKVGEYADIFGNDESIFTLELANVLSLYADASYRIEYRHNGSNELRLKKIERVKRVIEKCTNVALVNDLSDYDIEIRVTEEIFGTCVYLKPHYIDARFAYRINDVPASVKPSTAAVICAITGKFAPLHGETVVADYFCGSGTILIEWHKRYCTRELIGVDISGKAIEKAVENASAANAPIKFVRGDARKVHVDSFADVIVSNMPFGNRVGDHRSNVALYRDFFGSMKARIKDDAVAAIYTTEKKLTRACAADVGMKIVKECVLESGGMSPSLFIMKRK